MTENDVFYFGSIYKKVKDENYEQWSSIVKELDANTCRSYLNIKSYADMIYKLQWPDEEDVNNLKKSKYSENGFIPILIRGTVIDNLEREDKGLYIIHNSDCVSVDASNLLHLKSVKNIERMIVAFGLYSNRAYSIGDIATIKPGTRVILALTNISMSENNPNWIVANYCDIIPDEKDEYPYVDSTYRLHSSGEYFMEFNRRHTQMLSDSIKASETSEGCYIATCVYGSYDCPEVWTLRRYRDYTLKQTWLGRAFIRIYYKISPVLVGKFGKESWFKKMITPLLNRKVCILKRKGYSSEKYYD